MLSKVMDLHTATVGEICDHAVQRQGVAVVGMELAVGLMEAVLVTGSWLSSEFLKLD